MKNSLLTGLYQTFSERRSYERRSERRSQFRERCVSGAHCWNYERKKSGARVFLEERVMSTKFSNERVMSAKLSNKPKKSAEDQSTMVGGGVIIDSDFLAFLDFLHSTIYLMKGIEGPFD